MSFSRKVYNSEFVLQTGTVGLADCMSWIDMNKGSFVLKVTLVGALGLIGGTMGLFTGFSILTGIEILYFLAKFFFSLRLSKTEYQKRADKI